MKEVEITLKVNDNLEECKRKLEKIGFKIIRKSMVEDIYMAQNISISQEKDIYEILKKSVLIRYLNANGVEYKKITYKNKEYDNLGNIVSEKKINVDCNDVVKSIELFNALDFKELIRVKYDVTVMSDGFKEFAFQKVENLGLLLEYECCKNMDNSSNEEILQEKESMVKEVINAGISVDSEINVKKAYELIRKKYFFDKKNIMKY